MNALTKALNQSRAVFNSAYESALTAKAGFDVTAPSTALGAWDQYKGQAQARKKYSQFRGHVFSAVDAIASAASKQAVCVGRRIDQTNGKPKSSKIQSPFQRSKAVEDNIELLPNHFLVNKMRMPNPYQTLSNFIYMFVSNLCLTGFGYVIGDETKEGTHFYAVPTSWVTPVHEKGPFSEFKVKNPRDPNSESVTLTRDQVGFDMLPNPADPLSGLAPATSQNEALLIDENIQACQVQFFKHIINPSALVTVGRNPHPDVPGGVRPRLSAAQRRQVYAAIAKVMQGVENYGQPAIIDGMIEKIERLTATQNEIGWEKSEKTVRSRILSAFSIHPFILGEAISVGGHAQAEIIWGLFYDRVNVYLNRLSGVLTSFAGPFASLSDDLTIWLEKLVYENPERKSKNIENGFKNKVVLLNEYRTHLGLGPSDQEYVLDKQDAQLVATIAEKCKAGSIEVEQAVTTLVAMGIPQKDAKKIAGKGPDKSEMQLPPNPNGNPPTPARIEQDQPATETDQLEFDANELEESLKVLQSFRKPEIIADHILEKSERLLLDHKAKYDHIDFSVTDAMVKEAKQGLEWRREHGRGGTAVGIARARDISNGKDLSPDTWRRMKAFFDRHEVDKKAEGFRPGEDGYPSNGRISWSLWAGDPGYSRAKKIVGQMNAVDGKD